MEEIWRSERAESAWLKEGNINTKYFHFKASKKGAKYLIHQIKGDDGITITKRGKYC